MERADTAPGAPSVSAPDLIALLGDWPGQHPSLFRALALAVRQVIERGELAPGIVLPAERALAHSLNVSRGTVMNAFDLLREAGFVQRRQGSGTRVRLDAPRPVLPDLDHLGTAAASRSLSGRFFDQRPGVIDLAVSILHDAAAIRSVALPATWGELEAAGNGHGYSPQGLLPLREAVCGYYQDRGLRTTPEQVLVTAGAQQGLDLCAALAVRPGDAVLVESPTYPGAVDAFARHGARVVTIPFDSHWDRPTALREAVEEHAPRVVYLMPGMHNPTGQILDEQARRDVARLADRHALYVIEDHTLADVTFVPQDRPFVAAYSKQDRVLTLGSLSKSAWGGLRIGWVRGDSNLVARLARSKAAKDLSLSTLPQLVAQRVLADLEGVLAVRREQLAARSAFLQARLKQVLPSWSFTPPQGGLSLWVTLPGGHADEFAQTALRAGVAVIAGRAHCLDGAGEDHLRIAYSHPEAVLELGVQRLSDAWLEHLARHPSVEKATDCAVLEFRARSARAG